MGEGRRSAILVKLTRRQQHAVALARGAALRRAWDAQHRRCAHSCLHFCYVGGPCGRQNSAYVENYRDGSLLGVEWIATGLSRDEAQALDPAMSRSFALVVWGPEGRWTDDVQGSL